MSASSGSPEIDVQAILAQYGRENWSGPVPALEAAAAMAVKEFLKEEGMVLIASSAASYRDPVFMPGYYDDEDHYVSPHTVKPEQVTLGTVIGLDLDVRDQLTSYPTSVVAPLFLDNEYIPGAVGIWRRPQETPVEDLAA